MPLTTSGQTMNSVGFSISAVISGSTDVLSGTLTGVTSGIWDWWTFSYHYYGFTYTFPNLGVGTYELQALAGGSSEGVGYALITCHEGGYGFINPQIFGDLS
ncbi:MAG: hypothetical protein AMDU5_GPLC00017G0085 [Thermoplasmatales archaeon Gpl]|nr:MAG: hypothetical protein AMDU5_GPLC00017G0085 [Thermoplasmatales archaeon Gpl]